MTRENRRFWGTSNIDGLNDKEEASTTGGEGEKSGGGKNQGSKYNIGNKKVEYEQSENTKSDGQE